MLLVVASAIIVLSFVAAVTIAVRQRTMLTWTMAVLVGLVTLRAATYVIVERMPDGGAGLLIAAFHDSELPVALWAALSLVAVGVMEIGRAHV